MSSACDDSNSACNLICPWHLWGTWLAGTMAFGFSKGRVEEGRGETHQVCYRRGGGDSFPRDRLSPVEMIRKILGNRGGWWGGLLCRMRSSVLGLSSWYFDI